MPGALDLEAGLFGRLRRDARDEWQAYVAHAFIARLADGSLPLAAFRKYLVQDYLFLIQFARAYALAGYKSRQIADLRAAAAAVTTILETEMPLHRKYCAEWALSEADLEVEQEATETVAYTRFVLDAGLQGDLLDLHVALAPCVVGYAEIGARLAGRVAGNPYAAWIEAYSGDAYQRLARDAVDILERLGRERGAEQRYSELLETFRAAARLEGQFWDMGLKVV